MLTCRHVATYGATDQTWLSGLSDLTSAQIRGQNLLIATTQLRGGGVSSYSFSDPDTPLKRIDTQPFRGGLVYQGDLHLTPLSLDGGNFVHLSGAGKADHLGIGLSPSGALTGFATLFASGSLGTAITAMGQTGSGAGSLIHAAGKGDQGFTVYRIGANGVPVKTSEIAITASGTASGASVDQIVQTEAGGKRFLVAVSGLGDFISTHPLSDTGQLGTSIVHLGAMGAGYGTPTAVEAVQTGGRSFVIVAAAGTSSLTVFRLSTDGTLTPTDHILDELTTRFQNIRALETVQIGNRVLVFAGGTDDGISIFALQPDGRLLHLQTIADNNAMTLADVTDIEAQVVGGRIALFVASGRETGITQLSLDPGHPGLTGMAAIRTATGSGDDDLLLAQAGTSRLIGGAGDDILIATNRAITMEGGPGADTFVPSNFNGKITIADFEPGYDRLDLSQLGMIRSTWQLKYSVLAGGIRIRYQDTTLDILIRDGRSLSAGYFSNEMFPIAHYKVAAVDPTRISPIPSTIGKYLFGSANADTLLGGSGSDSIHAGGGNDVVAGQYGDDTIHGEAGHDTLRGQTGNDLIYAGAGNDNLFGDAGADRLSGQDGNDSLWGDTGHDQLDGGAGNDRIWGGSDNDRLTGGAENDTLSGDGGHDLLTDDRGDNLLIGGTGNDTLISGMGQDQLRGDDGADLMRAGDGSDSLWGHAGNDRLSGEGGNDFLFGGEGNDWLSGDNGNDLLDDRSGHNTLSGGAGDDVLTTGAGNDLLYGGEGHDRLNAGDGNDRLFGDNGHDTMIGGRGNDYLADSAGFNRFEGQDGDDTVTGGSGRDSIRGGAGRDFLAGGADYDRLSGDAGNDRILAGAGADTVYGGDGRDAIHGDGGNDRLFGNTGNDWIFGDQGNDLIRSGKGNDNLRGHAGRDRIFGDQGNDRIWGGIGADRIWGGAGKDRLFGNGQNDRLDGGAGNDRLSGGAGTDVLFGGHGADILTGGPGRDTFVFRHRSDSPDHGGDLITDFRHGIDRINLAALDLSHIGNVGLSGDDQLRWDHAGGQTHIYIDISPGQGHDMLIRLAGYVDLDRDDFLL